MTAERNISSENDEKIADDSNRSTGKHSSPTNHVGGNFFDSLMFGPRTQRQQSIQNQEQSNNEDSFDVFSTAQTMMETYQQLSPYMKGVTNFVKKFKK